MARNDPQVNIRLPASLKTGLDEAAEKAGRSLTAEIVYRLEQSLAGQAGVPMQVDPQRVVHDAYRAAVEMAEMLERYQAENKARLAKIKPRSEEATVLRAQVERGDEALQHYQLDRQRLFTLLGEIAIEKARGADPDGKWIKRRARELELGLFELI